ncbi:MAG TPA: T9SS type A sorting domain-containing protein [Hanamia sp.]|nr:T9SS type A sorting domain-containing protein [Hanamia sp.]
MKRIFYILFLFFTSNTFGQITSPVIKSNFGVDGDLSANFFNNFISIDNPDDDWFRSNPFSGIGVIDTSGAATINALYASDPNFRFVPFGRRMSVPPATIVNNKLLLAAVFSRDYHGNDSTVFTSGSKNGMSPADWICPAAQSVPDKNEILDVMAHMRRDGVTGNDSLWLFGGVSIENTNGDRYFDFEMYQTDIFYDKTTRKFLNYGPDAGHTSWQFDSSGKIIKAGDMILSADYGSSALSSLEARIWVNRAALSITPADFAWSGTFDGASSTATFGYAGIKPKSSGSFYIGIESSDSTWAGAFSLVRSDNTVVTNYNAGQFMEFAVNLTKLGLDPHTLLGNIGCNMLIKSVCVKTRASTSFTAELKDFVAPIDLSYDFKVKTASDASLLCGIVGPTALKVTNPVPTASYTWTTSDGHILGQTSGDSVMVDSAGTYVVNEALEPSCPSYAKDSIIVAPFNKDCRVLKENQTDFSAWLSNKKAQLNWSVTNNNDIRYFEVQSSTDGIHFSSFKKVDPDLSDFPTVHYAATDGRITSASIMYYQIKIVDIYNKISYSKIVALSTQNISGGRVKIFPNPVSDHMQLSIYATSVEKMKVMIFDASGRVMRTIEQNIAAGNSILNVSDFQTWPPGIYSIKVMLGNDLFVDKMILRK